MDTKLNPNGPSFELPDIGPPKSKTSPKKRKKIVKPLGLLLLAAVAFLFSLVVISEVNANNAGRRLKPIYGDVGTLITFASSSYASPFLYELGGQIEPLYTWLTIENENIEPMPDSTYWDEQYSPDGNDELVDVDRTGLRQMIKELAEDQLSMARDVLFFAKDKDGYLVFNDFSDGKNEQVSVGTSLLVFSLTNPPQALTDYSGHDFNRMAANLRKLGIIAEVYIPLTVYDGSSYMSDLLQRNEIAVQWLNAQRFIAVVSLAGLVVLLLFSLTLFRPSFVWAVGLLYEWYSKQPLLLKLFLTTAGVIFLVAALEPYGIYAGFSPQYELFPLLFFIGVCGLVMLYLLETILYLFVLLKGGRRVLRNELEARWLVSVSKQVLRTWKTKKRALIIRLLAGGALFMISLLLLFVGIFVVMDDVGGGLLVWFIATAGLWFASSFISLIFTHANMTLYAADIAAGLYPELPPQKGWAGEPLKHLSQVNAGMRKAVSEAVRSERLKAELVTNVSHDLKTPLTSIINYVALLKETRHTQQPFAAEYLDVIDRKSQRMRVLIDDLFDAAKINSGSLALEPEDVNIVDLLKQALGELSEKIDASGVQFICQYGTDHIMLWLDGRQIWRVFENLVGNILKYAPSGSRAYVSVEERDGYAFLTFKNVSNYAMDFEPEELFERFKRADVSRSTEGSGLGLNIARGIVEHSGGRMEITIDGDLFKAAVVFPLVLPR